MNAQEVQSLLQRHLPGAQITVLSDDNVHFSATIVAEQFVGKSRVQQQQLIYAVLQHYISAGTIHALTLKTYTPETWQQAQTLL